MSKAKDKQNQTAITTRKHVNKTKQHSNPNPSPSQLFSDLIYSSGTVSLTNTTDKIFILFLKNKTKTRDVLKYDSSSSKYTLTLLEDKVRGRVHKPGLLAVICIRRAICLRSDSGYPNKKLGAWDFLPPASFFTFFLSGPSLSVTRMSLETNYKKHQKRSSFRRCNFIVTASHFSSSPCICWARRETDDKHEV